MQSPETKLKVTEGCELSDRELKIAVKKKFNNKQENLERQFSKLRGKINKQKNYFTKEIKTIKRTKQK